MAGGQPPLLCCRYLVLEDGSLHIPWAQVADAGRYVCMATNAAGSERQRLDLHVLGRAAQSTACRLLLTQAVSV